MPICTTCTCHADYLYTVYESQYNLRLEHCAACGSFVDPYVEDPPLNILVDLLLLKRGVFRHLLYNRGAPPRRPAISQSDNNLNKVQQLRQDSKYSLLIKLGLALTLLDAFIRWSNHIHLAENMTLNAQSNESQPSPLSRTEMLLFLRIFARCIAETLSFHLGVVVSAFAIMQLNKRSGLLRRLVGYEVHPEFRMILIPLSLFYSSLTKLFFLFLLSLWTPTSSTPSSTSTNPMGSLEGLYSIFDDNNIDREWIVRNILGGISAGFGLRVILNLHPILVSLIILTGWGAKNGVSFALHHYIHFYNPDQKTWLAYSIP